MPSSVSDNFEMEFAEIKKLVEKAREASDNNQYRQAKSLFLDAASKSLELSKRTTEIEALTFQNITRMLVDSAKEMKQLIELETKPLPSIPNSKNKPTLARSSTKDVFKPKSSEPVVKDPHLLQLMVIRSTGLPLFTWTSKILSENTQMKINDILFSGAITAVNNLISEVLSKPIQSIQFEDGNIVFKFIDDLIFVVFIESDPEAIETNINQFSKKFINKLLPRYEVDIQQGKVLNSNPDVLETLETCFQLDK